MFGTAAILQRNFATILPAPGYLTQLKLSETVRCYRILNYHGCGKNETYIRVWITSCSATKSNKVNVLTIEFACKNEKKNCNQNELSYISKSDFIFIFVDRFYYLAVFQSIKCKNCNRKILFLFLYKLNALLTYCKLKCIDADKVILILNNWRYCEKETIAPKTTALI